MQHVQAHAQQALHHADVSHPFWLPLLAILPRGELHREVHEALLLSLLRKMEEVQEQPQKQRLRHLRMHVLEHLQLLVVVVVVPE